MARRPSTARKRGLGSDAEGRQILRGVEKLLPRDHQWQGVELALRALISHRPSATALAFDRAIENIGREADIPISEDELVSVVTGAIMLRELTQIIIPGGIEVSRNPIVMAIEGIIAGVKADAPAQYRRDNK